MNAQKGDTVIRHTLCTSPATDARKCGENKSANSRPNNPKCEKFSKREKEGTMGANTGRHQPGLGSENGLGSDLKKVTCK